MIKLFNKKTAILILIAAVLFSIAPKTTFAFVLLGVPTVETNPILVGGQQTAAASTWGQLGQVLFQYAKDVALETFKRQILNMMVDQIVQWIQGGGNPKFITNWPGFFRDAVDQAGGKFIQGIGLSQLCSPFKLLLSAAFIPIPTFTERTSCTLSQVGVNIDAFLKDFKQGNWIAWQEMVLRPQNNVYGAYVMAWDQYNIEKSAAEKASAAEAQAGKGFLSVKRCLKYDQAKLNACNFACKEIGVNSLTGEGKSNEELAPCRANCQKTSCAKYETITPGAVVGDITARAVGSNIDYIVNAKDLAAYTAAITNAILNRMFAEGVGLLRAAITPSPSSPSGLSSAQAQCVQLLGTAAYSDCITAMQTGADIREFQKNYLISSIDQDLTYQNQLLGAKQATLTILNQSVDILNQLKDCQKTTPPELIEVQNTASTTASQIVQIQSDIIALQIIQQEIKAIIDVTQIPSFWAKVAGVVKPELTYSLVLAAQDETVKKQQDMSLYQQQLTQCELSKLSP